MKNILRNAYVFLLILVLFNKCGNSIINPPKPEAAINPLVGFIAASIAIAPLLNLQYSTCEGADEIKIGETKTGTVATNSMKFFKLSNSNATDYVRASFSVTSGSSSSSGSYCMFVAKEDLLIDTNSSTNTLDYPSSTSSSSSSSCSTSYSFEITKNKFRCIGIASYRNISISLSVTQTNSSEPATVSSFTPSTGPVGTLVTLTGKNFNSSSSIYFGSSSSAAAIESSAYSELKVRVPPSATTGSVKLGSSGASVGTFTLTTTTMMTRSTPGCTFTSINGNGGTAISFTSQYGGSTKSTIGFSFTYFGAVFDSIYVGTSGGASFLSSGSSSTFSSLSSATTPYFAIAPWWGSSMNLDSSSSVQYALTGTSGSRVFTIEWVNYPTSTSISVNTYRVNFQIKLYEGTNLVELIYGTKTGSTGASSANVGIKNGIGGSGNFMDGISGSTTSATSYASDTNFPSANTCYRFTP